MTKIITLDEFMLATENEGFEGVARYYGSVEVENQPELTNAFKEFQEFLDILEDHYLMWEEETEEVE